MIKKRPLPAWISVTNDIIFGTFAITVSTNLLKWVNCEYPDGEPPFLVLSGPVTSGGLECWTEVNTWRTAISLYR